MADFKVGDKVRLKADKLWGWTSIDAADDARIVNDMDNPTAAYKRVFELAPAAPPAEDKALAYLRMKLTSGGVMYSSDLGEMLREVYGLRVEDRPTLVPVT